MAAGLKVIYARQEGGEQRVDYGLTMLKLALDKAGVQYELQPSTDVATTQARTIDMIKGGVAANITWSGTGPQLEKELLPVRVPIDRGILGWRLMIIDGARQAEFSAVKSLADLQKLQAGQGIGWADTDILQHNGIKVQSSKFETLFKMVGARRFDFFPLGANEVFLLNDQFKAATPNLAVEKDVVLVYPFAMFFFVTPGQTELAGAIETGLKKAMADGSFDQVLRNHVWLKDAFGRADLPHRRVIRLDNPFLTPETRALPADMFYQP